MRELIDFTDAGVVVTGGAGGIGQTVVREFAAEGANVAIADIDRERGQAVADLVDDEFETTVTFVETDIGDYGDCQDCVETVVDAFDHLDVLVNAAASRKVSLPDKSRPFLEQEPSYWDPELSITLKGSLNMAHAALPHMIDRGSGSIVNFSSDSHRGQDPNITVGDHNLTVYAAAKAGIVTFTKSLAKEVGPDGVRVNAIAPGIIQTPHTSGELSSEHEQALIDAHPLRRIGRPSDCAYLVVFLASDAADWITGQTVSVNGGFL